MTASVRPMPRMLQRLSRHLDAIREANEADHRFLVDLIADVEARPGEGLSDDDFMELLRLHKKYRG